MILRLVAICSLAVSSASCAEANDLSLNFEKVEGQFCEIRLGENIEEISIETTRVPIETENGTEIRYSVILCEQSIPATISVDASQTIEQIVFENANQCYDGICIGETYSNAVGESASMETFISAAEGGVFSISQTEGVNYFFDISGLNIECFHNPDSCEEEIASAKVAGIILY